MNILNLSKIIIIMFLPLAVFADYESKNSVPTKSDVTDALHEVQFLLIFPKTIFTNGEGIVAWSMLTNRTESPVKVRPADVRHNLTLAVTNEKDNSVAQIKEKYGFEGSTIGSILLPPHGCHSNSIAIDKLYNLEPGIYNICAKCDMALHRPWGINIQTSSVVTIKIVAFSEK